MNSEILKDPSKYLALALVIIPIPTGCLLVFLHYAHNCCMGMHSSWVLGFSTGF